MLDDLCDRLESSAVAEVRYVWSPVLQQAQSRKQGKVVFLEQSSNSFILVGRSFLRNYHQNSPSMKQEHTIPFDYWLLFHTVEETPLTIISYILSSFSGSGDP